MTEPLLVGFIAAAAAIGGSIVTGWFTYAAAMKQLKAEKYKRKLIRSLKDVAAFHRLEARYTEALQSESKSADAWKREIRRKQSDDGFDTPSQDATSREAERQLAALERCCPSTCSSGTRAASTR